MRTLTPDLYQIISDIPSDARNAVIEGFYEMPPWGDAVGFLHDAAKAYPQSIVMSHAIATYSQILGFLERLVNLHPDSSEYSDKYLEAVQLIKLLKDVRLPASDSLIKEIEDKTQEGIKLCKEMKSLGS